MAENYQGDQIPQRIADEIERDWLFQIRPVEAKRTILSLGVKIAKELEQQREMYAKLTGIHVNDLYVYPAFVDHRLPLEIKKKEMRLVKRFGINQNLDNHGQEVPFELPANARDTDSISHFGNEGSVIFEWDDNGTEVYLRLSNKKPKNAEPQMVRRGRLKYLEYSLFMRDTFENVVGQLRESGVEITDRQIQMSFVKWNKFPQYRFALTKQMVSWLALFQVLEDVEPKKSLEVARHYIDESYIRSFLATENIIKEEQLPNSRVQIKSKLKRNYDNYQLMCILSIASMKQNGINAMVPDEVIYGSMMQLYMIGAFDNNVNPEEQSIYYNNYRNIQYFTEEFIGTRNWETMLIKYGSGLSNAMVYYPHIAERRAYINKHNKASIMDELEQTKNLVCDQILLFVFGCLPSSTLANTIYALPYQQKRAIIRMLLK
jgi:hypothetical protein